ncbi:hypothetical protein K2X40_02390 [Candidatus Babeliales bacterium]|nr:hypothetical protein [Candidatus Babeliales bacterium]
MKKLFCLVTVLMVGAALAAEEHVVIRSMADLEKFRAAHLRPSASQPAPEAAAQPVVPDVVVPVAEGAKIMGCVRVDGQEEVVPQFRVYFDGMATMSNRDGFFSFPLENSAEFSKYSLVLSKNVEQRFVNTNTLKSLCVRKDKPYRQFSFTRTGTSDGVWNWEETYLPQNERAVGRNTIMVLVDPKFVDYLEPWEVRLEGNLVKLPRIVLKKKKKEKLPRAAAKSLLYSLDSTIFHEPVQEATKRMAKGKGQISLAP